MTAFWDVFVGETCVGRVQAEWGESPVLRTVDVWCHLVMDLEQEEGRMQVWRIV